MANNGDELIRLSLKIMSQRGQLSYNHNKRLMMVKPDHYWFLTELVGTGILRLRVKHHSRTSPNNERWSEVFKLDRTTGEVKWGWTQPISAILNELRRLMILDELSSL